MNFDKFAGKITTKSQLVSAISKIEQIKNSLYVKSANLPFQLEEAVAEIIRENNISAEKPLEVQKMLNELIDFLRILPVLHITTAFIPNSTTVQRIAGQIQSQAGKKFVLDFVKDKNLLGKVILELNGKRVMT